MTTELTLLSLAILWGLLQVFLHGWFVTRQNGSAYNMGARDEQKPLEGVGARMERALRNYKETFPFFAVAVLIAEAAGRNDGFTLAGAHLYFWARLVYLPLYLTGIPVVRSVVWGLSVLGILLVLLGLF